MTSLDPAYCADGCGRLAETERPQGVSRDGEVIVELVCRRCALDETVGITFDQDMGEL